MRNVRSLILKSLILSAIAGFTLTSTLPAPAQAFPGMAQEKAPAAAQGQVQQGQVQQGPSGKVVETVNSGGYTYVCFENGGKKVWAAVPQTQVQVGQHVMVGEAFEMKNFTSQTLNHTFETIFFGKQLTIK